MKMGLFLLLALIVASVVGTLVPQDQAGEVGRLSRFLQLGDVYHSWWYVGLVGLLTLNLVGCTVRRLRLLSAGLSRKGRLLEPAQISRLDACRAFTRTGALNIIEKKVTSILTREGYELWSEVENDKVRIGAKKGRFHVLGSFITHVSLVVIVIGVLYGGMGGYKGTIDAPVGTNFSLSQVPGLEDRNQDDNCSIRVDDFRVERYPDGSPSGYYSRLTVLENNQPAKTAIVGVNSPLVYQGVKVYQARYGQAVEIKVHQPDGETSLSGVVTEGDVFPVVGTDLSVLVYRCLHASDSPAAVTAVSSEAYSSQVMYAIVRDNQYIGMGNAKIGQSIPLEKGKTLEFTRLVPYTGLEIKKDPGVPVVWTGAMLMLLGMGMMLVLQPRKIWVMVEQKGALVTVTMGGTAHKNRLAFTEHFNRLADEISLGKIQ